MNRREMEAHLINEGRHFIPVNQSIRNDFPHRYEIQEPRLPYRPNPPMRNPYPNAIRHFQAQMPTLQNVVPALPPRNYKMLTNQNSLTSTISQHQESNAHLIPRENGPSKSNRSRKTNPEQSGEKCRDCMTRIPYATLIATIMCCGGVGVFCGTMYRGTTLTLLMFDEVFHIKITWVEPVKLTFMIIGAAMGGLGLMILFLGCLSTGSTRAKVYRTWRGRVGGRVSCAIFMGITYLLSVVWLLIFIMLVIVTSFYTIALFQCKTIPWEQCIDYNQFAFLFPPTSTEEDRRVCDIDGEKKTYCHDCVNNSVVMFLLATGAAFFVIMSLIHYLMCLSSNYAHIKDQEKFIDLQEIQYLHESEMSTLPKDRF